MKQSQFLFFFVSLITVYALNTQATELTEEEKSPSNEFKFCGIVESVKPIPRSRGLSYHIVSADPRYYIWVKTDTPVSLGIKRYDANSVQAFAIHSVSKHFNREMRDILGQRYGFTFTRSPKQNGVSRLEVGSCK